MIWLLFLGCREPGTIPEDTVPCDEPRYWTESIEGEHPFLVHYRDGEEEMAEAVRGYLDRSWEVEIDDLGFRPPVDDTGVCGPDERFDAFLWDGLEVAYVDAMEENAGTSYDDWITYMALDPWGPYGGDILDGTVAHEFNHACQASDDWWDSPIIFEMTSVLMEEAVYDDDNDYLTLLYDFQSRPGWSVDRNDDYETWYMYAAVTYLLYVRDRFFEGDASFAADMWLAMRNPAGNNEPDFEDALDDLLAANGGTTYLDSVVEFARWRWYTGARDDGQHFEEGATWPAEANVAVLATVSAAPDDVEVEVMALGSAYVEVTTSATVSLVDADPGVTWVVQALPGTATDGDLLTLPTTVSAGHTLVLTALPLPADADPDTRTDTLHTATLHFE